MKHLLRALFVAALPAILTFLIRKLDRRLSGSPERAESRRTPVIDDLPVIEPRQDEPLLPSRT